MEETRENFRQLIPDDKIFSEINLAHSEFLAGNVKSANEILTSPDLKLDLLSPLAGTSLLRQRAGYFFQTGEKEKCLETLKILGSLYLKNNEYENAIKTFSTARSLDPECINLKFQIATCVVESGDIPVGVAKLKSLVEEKPDFDEAILLLLKSSKRYRPESVVSLIPEHLKRNPTDTTSFRYVIDIYEELGKKNEAIQARAELTKLLEGEDGLDSFVMESSRLYPGETQFTNTKLRLALASSNTPLVTESLAELADLSERRGQIKDALFYTELMLLVDLNSERLMTRVKRFREELGFKSSPLEHKLFPSEMEQPPPTNKLLKLDFGIVINSITANISENLIGDMELSKFLRSVLLDKIKLRQSINNEFEGKSSTPVELWASLQALEKSPDKLKELRLEHPDSKPVLETLLKALKSDDERIKLWIKIATQAKDNGKLSRMEAILKLMAHSTISLGEYITQIEPLLKESYR